MAANNKSDYAVNLLKAIQKFNPSVESVILAPFTSSKIAAYYKKHK
jgi:hypothetical protein